MSTVSRLSATTASSKIPLYRYADVATSLLIFMVHVMCLSDHCKLYESAEEVAEADFAVQSVLPTFLALGQQVRQAPTQWPNEPRSSACFSNSVPPAMMIWV